MQISPTAKLEDFSVKMFRTKKRRETFNVGRAREKAVAVRSIYLKLNLKALMLNGTTSALNTFHAVQILQKSQPIRNNAPNVVLNQVATHTQRKTKLDLRQSCARGTWTTLPQLLRSCASGAWLRRSLELLAASWVGLDSGEVSFDTTLFSDVPTKVHHAPNRLGKGKILGKYLDQWRPCRLKAAHVSTNVVTTRSKQMRSGMQHIEQSRPRTCSNPPWVSSGNACRAPTLSNPAHQPLQHDQLDLKPYVAFFNCKKT